MAQVTIDNLVPGNVVMHDHAVKRGLEADLPISHSDGEIFWTTDTKRLWISDGTYWYTPDPSYIDTSPKPGVEQYSDKRGYGDDYISSKTLHNIAIKGHPETPKDGSIRIDTTKDPITFEIYLRDVWQTILYDPTYEYGDFRHTPIDKEIYVWRGDSVAVGLNGRPIVSEYKVFPGAYPPPRVMSGGTF